MKRLLYSLLVMTAFLSSLMTLRSQMALPDPVSDIPQPPAMVPWPDSASLFDLLHGGRSIKLDDRVDGRRSDGDGKASLMMSADQADDGWDVCMGGDGTDVNGLHGPDGQVYAIAVAGSKVYVGGNFTHIAHNGVSEWFNYIAVWDTNTRRWSALTTSGSNAGVNNRVNAIAVLGDDVYVAGGFTAAGQTSTHYVARWNTQTERWYPLGAGTAEGLDGVAYALVVDAARNRVYIGGNFVRAGGNIVNGVVYWNAGSSSWGTMNGGVSVQPGSPSVFALAVDGSNVYAGGWFDKAGTTDVSNIARWNASTGSWAALGSGVSGDVYALAVKPGSLYAGGEFTQAGGGTMNHIARWTGSQWATVGGGVAAVSSGGTIRAIGIAADGSIYVTGALTTAGTTTVNHIAKWDGTTWSPLGSGINVMGRALAVAGNGDVYVGGDFTAAGGKAANFVARWTSPPPQTSLSPEDSINDLPIEMGLSWNPVQGGYNYRLQVSEDPGFASFFLHRVDAGTSDTVRELRYNTTYFWRVRAEKGACFAGDWSTTRSFTTPKWPAADQGPVVLLKITGAPPEVTKVAISSSENFDATAERECQSLIGTQGFARFKGEDFKELKDIGSIRRIDLLDESDKLYGHIGIESIQAGRVLHAILYYHGDLETSKGRNPDWEYYADDFERPVSMLVPPLKNGAEKFDSMDTSRQLGLFVHGVSGRYPYFGDDLVDYICRTTFDGWKFYYPYDQEIEQSGVLLQRAIDCLLQARGPLGEGLYNGRVNIVAHSMGGLVVRAYTQTENYDHNINKVLMIGTPNHGSLSCVRLVNLRDYGLVKDPFAWLWNEWVLHKDQYAPAYSEMIPNSEPIFVLNAASPRMLGAGKALKDSYLMIAGTHGGLLTEIPNQDDGIVSVSSASLLDFGIPLATMDISHSDGEVNDFVKLPVVAAEFFSRDYDPNNPSYNFLQNVDGFWPDRENSVKHDGSISIEFGMLCLKLSGGELAANVFSISYPECDMDELITISPRGLFYSNLLINVAETNNYFAYTPPNLSSLQYPALAVPICPLYDKVRIQSIFTLQSGVLPKTIEIVGSCPVYPLETTTRELHLSSGTIAILNVASQGGWNNIHIVGTSTSKQEVSLLSASDTTAFNVDSRTDSFFVFLLTTAPTDSALFASHQMTLVAPDGEIVDSDKVDSNAIFHQLVSDGIAYYYIRDPRPGTWKVAYDRTIPNTTLLTSFSSDLRIEMQVADSIYLINDTVRIDVRAPLLEGEGNDPHISAYCRYTPAIGVPFVKEQQILLDPNDDSTMYCGYFVGGDTGVWSIHAEWTCNLDSEGIRRNASKFVRIHQPVPDSPLLVTPLPDEIMISHIPYLSWNAARGAEFYQLQLAGDTLFDGGIIADTMINGTAFGLTAFDHDSLYHWRVRGINETGIGPWSSVWRFRTIKSVPSVPELRSPPDRETNVGTLPVFAWRSTAYAESYTLEIASDSLFDNLVQRIDGIGAADTLFELGLELMYSTSFYWRLRSENIWGLGDWSVTRSFKTIVALPTAPRLLQPPNGAMEIDMNVSFLWMGESDVENYFIQIARSGDSSGIVEDTLTNSSDSQMAYRPVEKLRLNTEYQWRVRAANAAGTGPWSEFRSFITGEFAASTGPSDALERGTTTVHIYPNPSATSAVIDYSLNHRSFVVLELLNVRGERIAILANQPHSAGHYTVQVDVSAYPPGAYICRMKTDDVLYTSELLITR